LPIVETDLNPATIGVHLAPIAVPSLTGNVVLAGIFKTDSVFRSAFGLFCFQDITLEYKLFFSVREVIRRLWMPSKMAVEASTKK
jgi:hypothetical protein